MNFFKLCSTFPRNKKSKRDTNEKRNQATSSQASLNLKPNNNKSDKNQRAKKKCAWCGDQSHQTFQCKTYGSGQWGNKQCNRCKGYAHPQRSMPDSA